MAILAPGVTILFAVPAMIALGGVVLLLLMNRIMKKKQQRNFETISTTTAILSSVCFIAMAFVFEKLLTFHLSVAVATMIGFGLITLLPVIVSSPVIKQSYAKVMVSVGLLWIGITSWAGIQPAYSPDAPQHLNIRYIVNQDEHRIALHNQERDIPEALQNAFDDNFENAPVYPWLKYRYPAVEIEPQPMHETLVEYDVLDLEGENKLVNLKLGSPTKDYFETRVFIPTFSKLKKITKDNESLWYENEADYYPGYYEYRCRGEQCAQQKLTLEYQSEEAVTIIVVTLYNSLPKTYQYLSELKGNKAVSVHDGDKTIVISKHQLGSKETGK